MTKKKKPRTLESDYRQIIITLLEMSLQSDLEMVNMGDWSGKTYANHTYDKRWALDHLQKGGKLADIAPEVMADAFYTFKLWYRMYKEF